MQLLRGQGRRLGFTKALAQENAREGITVNAICPGYINTDMVQAVPKDVLEKSILPLIPIGRLGEPEEIARCVVFLASDDAGFSPARPCPPTAGSISLSEERHFGSQLRRQFELREFEAGRDGAADERPIPNQCRIRRIRL